MTGELWTQRLALIGCFIVATLLGFDIQGVSVAAPRMMGELGLNAGQLGWLFAVSNIGLFFGSLIGGRIGDRLGDRHVLAFAVALFAIFTIYTAYAKSFPLLVFVRAACGVGFGATLPNLLSVGTRIADPDARFSVTAAIFWGVPLGGLGVAAFMSSLGAHQSWAVVFQLGGILSLASLVLVVPSLRRVADAGAQTRERANINPFAALFAEGRWQPTLLIWMTFVACYVAAYVASNWLPVLATHRGVSHGAAPLTLVAFSVSGIFGTLILGRLSDRFGPGIPVGSALIAAFLALVVLSAVATPALIFPVSAVLGFTLSGACISLYALTTFVYPPEARGLGSGASLAAARFGAVAGPLAAGLLLNGGVPTSRVLLLPAAAAIVAAATLVAVSAPRFKRAFG